jgi:ketosteroid isomerase-like protein
VNADLRIRREAVVREHMESENRHDFAATMATFAHPRYELMASGQVFDGREEVDEYFRVSRAAVPDQRNELVSMRSTDDAVIVELDLIGTPAKTGTPFRQRICAFFIFEDAGDGIVCERVYYSRS